MKLTIGLVLICIAGIGFCTEGVDVSQYTDVFSCSYSTDGYRFVITRGYQSGGRVDPNAQLNINNARAAGFQYVDVYLFPCVSCGI